MLSKRQKAEFVKDGLNEDHRRNFAKGRELERTNPRTLDELLKFLNELQKLRPFSSVSSKATITRFNKL